jgi:hypothetical protein
MATMDPLILKPKFRGSLRTKIFEFICGLIFLGFCLCWGIIALDRDTMEQVCQGILARHDHGRRDGYLVLFNCSPYPMPTVLVWSFMCAFSWSVWRKSLAVLKGSPELMYDEEGIVGLSNWPSWRSRQNWVCCRWEQIKFINIEGKAPRFRFLAYDSRMLRINFEHLGECLPPKKLCFKFQLPLLQFQYERCLLAYLEKRRPDLAANIHDVISRYANRTDKLRFGAQGFKPAAPAPPPPR